jgi:hypothetical protein
MSAEEVVKLPRWEQRLAQRKKSQDLARNAARARQAKKRHGNIVTQVEAAQFKLAGANTAGAVQVIESASSADRDILLLAEEFGQARKGVLRQFGPVRSGVRAAYVQAAGLTTPNESPDGAKE